MTERSRSPSKPPRPWWHRSHVVGLLILALTVAVAAVWVSRIHPSLWRIAPWLLPLLWWRFGFRVLVLVAPNGWWLDSKGRPWQDPKGRP